MSSSSAMAQDIPDDPLAFMTTQSLLSPRKQHGLADSIGEALPLSPEILATPARSCFVFGSVPPARASNLAKPPLLQALMSSSTEQVRLALEANPEAAQFPFWDHGMEPPLCCAVRNDCCSDIIEMLLTSGADVSLGDRRGNLPLTLLDAKIAHFENLSLAYGFADIDSPPWASGLAGFGVSMWRLAPSTGFEEPDLPSLTMPTLPSPSVALQDKMRSRTLLEAAGKKAVLHTLS
eukprot:TRINITY_DN14209_c0_g1_i1.p1 TRINITY_DN14209_c0_g1~~TRINITY_DN14209_c0_g1_i1.p1  ORF type:complete len:235 (+),score=57.02 TRINITY_DN14209_c0_g1_i1:105-809(+)